MQNPRVGPRRHREPRYPTAVANLIRLGEQAHDIACWIGIVARCVDAVSVSLYVQARDANGGADESEDE